MSPRESKTRDWRHNDRPSRPWAAEPPIFGTRDVGSRLDGGTTMTPRQEYHPVQGAYPGEPSNDPFLASLRAEVQRQRATREAQEAECADCGAQIMVPADEDPADTLCVGCADDRDADLSPRETTRLALAWGKALGL